MDFRKEIIRFELACTECIKQTDSDVLKEIFQDRHFKEKIADYIKENTCTAIEAVNDVSNSYIECLLMVESEEIRDGAIDIGLARNL